MKFKLDENLPVELLSTLREAGHEADSVVLFRPPSSGRRTVFDFVGQNLQKILDLDLRGRLVVVSGTGVRTR